MTMTSFVASATSIPFSMAATVGLRPDIPTVATRQTSASLSSTARSAESSPQYAFAPNSRARDSSLSRELRAATATTEKSSGCDLTTSAALAPMDPVAPSIAILFTDPRQPPLALTAFISFGMTTLRSPTMP